MNFSFFFFNLNFQTGGSVSTSGYFVLPLKMVDAEIHSLCFWFFFIGYKVSNSFIETQKIAMQRNYHEHKVSLEVSY